MPVLQPAVQLPTLDDLVQRLGLAPHPEGGYFKESFRDAAVINQSALPERYSGSRNCSTAIYFALQVGQASHLHRLASSEAWHFYAGCPLTVVEIHPNGALKQTRLGHDMLNGQMLQHIVPPGVVFG